MRGARPQPDPLDRHPGGREAGRSADHGPHHPNPADRHPRPPRELAGTLHPARTAQLALGPMVQPAPRPPPHPFSPPPADRPPRCGVPQTRPAPTTSSRKKTYTNAPPGTITGAARVDDHSTPSRPASQDQIGGSRIKRPGSRAGPSVWFWVSTLWKPRSWFGRAASTLAGRRPCSSPTFRKVHAAGPRPRWRRHRQGLAEGRTRRSGRWLGDTHHVPSVRQEVRHPPGNVGRTQWVDGPAFGGTRRRPRADRYAARRTCQGGWGGQVLGPHP